MSARLNLSDVEHRLRKALEQSPDWAAVLNVIAEKTPPEIRLQSLEMSRESGKPGVIMHALVRLDEAKDPAGLIQTYVNALESVPLITAVRLGGTQRTNISGHDSQKFDLSLNVVPLPHAAAAKLPALTAQNPEGK
jgi:Tfp pilus assembly protein PilN